MSAADRAQRGADLQDEHRGLLWGLGAGLVGLVLLALVVSAAFDAVRVPANAEEIIQERFPEPRLEERPARTLEALRRWEEERLGSYGPSAIEGRYRIPVERARKLLLRQGFPRRREEEGR